MFAPLPVPERFQQGFERGMAVRPLQIRAEAEDGAGMAREAAAMQDRYGELRLPMVIMAGSDDQVADVGRQSIRLHEQIPHSQLELIPGAGHMVYHAVPQQVADAVEAVANGHRDRRWARVDQYVATRCVCIARRRWRQSNRTPEPCRTVITSSRG